MANRPPRPGGLDLRSQSYQDSIATGFSLGDLPSPRIGEVPPALSPLDALALQGRLLAKKFDEEKKAGRRMSRLPPLTIHEEFGNRPQFFRSISQTTTATNDSQPSTPPEVGTAPKSPRHSPEQNKPSDRHKSYYPQIQSEELHFDRPLPFRNHLAKVDEAEQPTPTPPKIPQDYFAIPRALSPEPVEPRIGRVQEATPITPAAPRPRNGSSPMGPPRKLTGDSLTPSLPPSAGLLPPRSPASLRSPRASPSIRSIPYDSSDEVEDMSLASSYDSLPTKQLSTNSSVSRSHSPYSLYRNHSLPRSPSLSSETSAGGTQLPRPSFNFSRPISNSGRPAFDTRPSFDPPSRQGTDDSAVTRPSYDAPSTNISRQYSNDSPITNYTNESVHTPVSMTSEDFRRSSDSHNAPAPSYTYTKFSLPRGRALDRRSVCAEDFLNSQIRWDKPAPSHAQAAPIPISQTRPSSPPSPPHSLDRPRTQPEAEPSLRSASIERPSLASSNSTIRQSRPRGSAEVTAQEHCDKGIALHEAGEFTKSTYHLRLAALAGLPEAMFWYGLACRHGWGMRENKAEGMQWLRHAVDSGQLEVADDEDDSKQGKPIDIAKRNRHRAQYAVAIYELGKCYMNGWGAPADRSLALRCYEIAGNWGDADALTEAAYSYAEGIGCKKDLKKAAKFYRAAEARGVSMVGNSWIYKDKYMDDSNDHRSVRSGRSSKKSDADQRKPRDKSRTRTIFSRKKSNAA